MVYSQTFVESELRAAYLGERNNASTVPTPGDSSIGEVEIRKIRGISEIGATVRKVSSGLPDRGRPHLHVDADMERQLDKIESLDINTFILYFLQGGGKMNIIIRIYVGLRMKF